MASVPPTTPGAKAVSLRAKSPFEMRVHLGDGVADMEVREALKTGDLGFLHSFTTGSAVDGPGLRVVGWTTACMFRCQYCHNPDTWTLKNGIPVPLGRAVEEIRKYAAGLIAMKGDPDTWTLKNGIPVPLGRAVEEIRKYAAGLIAMKGGFTLSGGEPLMQDRFAARLFAAVKAMGVHTAIETNGWCGDSISDAELRDIDLVILDMKAFTLAQHARVTGIANNDEVLGFCNRLAALGRPMWLRYVLVPGLTDLAEEMRAVAAFGASLGVVERVEILPFHQLGHYKWAKLQLDYKLTDVQPPSTELVARAIDLFRQAGLEAA